MKKTKIICIVGATASGKTELGVRIAKAVNGEIISADSMQVYRGMPIATAAPSQSERQGIKHHLVECLDASSPYSAADFALRARELITQMSRQNIVPIIVGGTGLFVDTLTNGIKFSDVGADYELRKKSESLSNDELYSLLLSADPDAAQNIHPNNRKRVIRALELCNGGVTKTEQNRASLPDEPPYDTLFLGIAYRDRQKLYDRINERVDRMIENGLADEARKMRNCVSSTAAQAIGHKELYPYLDGEITLDEAVENLKKETRHYAKRQITWFKRNSEIHWLFADEFGFERLCSEAEKSAEKFILEDSDEKNQKR